MQLIQMEKQLNYCISHVTTLIIRYTVYKKLKKIKNVKIMNYSYIIVEQHKYHYLLMLIMLGLCRILNRPMVIIINIV